MPLIVGVKDAEKREGFNAEENLFLKSFEMSTLAMSAGVGRIGGDSKYSHNISAEEAAERFAIVAHVYDIDMTEVPYAWLADVDFLRSMGEADWYCNVGNDDPVEFAHKIGNIVVDRVWYKVRPKHVPRPERPNWHDAQKRFGAIKQVIGVHLTGGDWMDECIETLLEQHEPLDYDKPFYDGKYLRWDDGRGYYLSDEPESE